MRHGNIGIRRWKLRKYKATACLQRCLLCLAMCEHAHASMAAVVSGKRVAFGAHGAIRMHRDTRNAVSAQGSRDGIYGVARAQGNDDAVAMARNFMQDERQEIALKRAVVRWLR